MTSATSPSTTDSKDCILEDGVVFWEDHIVGERVDQITKNGFPFKTEEGLDFCRINTLEDERIRNVVEAVFDWSALGFFKAFGPDPDHSFCWKRKPQTEIQLIVVQLWSSGSRMIFYKGSHKQRLDAKPAGNGLIEPSPELLRQPGITPVEVEMKEGGMSIIDGRLGVTILQGIAITFGFATREELKEWAKMELPKAQNLIEKVSKMGSTTIGVNFVFV